jgi:DNA-binding transcriptional regulator YhcF (GntR family)
VQTYRLITVAVLVDRLKINGSLARKALADLEEKGVIKKVVGHSKLSIYSEFLLRSLAFADYGIWRQNIREMVNRADIC